jgi:hypothetical protein
MVGVEGNVYYAFILVDTRICCGLDSLRRQIVGGML